ncbi:hypothetical protein L9F63_016086 [Diploptera punctata]|uniref:Uncharacterized protein n=1 Tax=Diploptera punctata TaxID=6984 RepID=A0AAD8A2P1_DIPPU|nr:hypothetical protein L9F63_016086 [Diploptera punctata]
MRQWLNKTFYYKSKFYQLANMNTKHLAEGSTNPPLSKGKLRLYSMRFCPYAQRAHLVLDAKKIPYDIVNINLVQKPKWYFERNPVGKVPAIELESGDTVYESLIIADYLDEIYPQSPLHNKNPIQKAKDRILIENFSKVTGAIFGYYRDMSEEKLENLLKELDVFDKELTKRGKTFFGGDKPGMVDYMIWPWFERLDALKKISDNKFVIPESRIKKLAHWMKSMKSDEAVKVSYIDPESHGKFVKSFLDGSPNYDILVK